MLRPTVLCLLLACAVSLSSSAVILENGMPILWAQAYSQVTDLPMQNGIVAPNPWNFLHRMSLGRLMIAATDPFMGSMGTNATDSPLWSMPLQLGWMKTSGRLADPTSDTTCGQQTGDAMCISTQSWWGCVNYFSFVMPFLSAAKHGFMGDGVQVQMQVPEGEADYCTTYDDCASRYPDAMTKWDAFFQGLRSTTESPLPDNEKKDSLLGVLWAAQMATTHASAACKPRQSKYSSKEVSFANSWLNIAEYLSAVHFQSSLEKSEMFISTLPSRVLQADDNAPRIADLSDEENHTLYVFSWMDTINGLLGGRLVDTWKRAMCSVSVREKGREMMEQLVLNPSFATTSFVSIVTGMGTSC